MSNNIASAASLLEDIVRANGEEVYTDRGTTKDEKGYLQETYNIKVTVWKIETDDDILHFVETKDSGDMREFERLEIEDGQSIQDAVTEQLKGWDSEWVEVFQSENIISDAALKYDWEKKNQNIAVESREDPDLQGLLEQWRKIDPNGWAIMTDGSLDDRTDAEIIAILRENIETSLEG